MDKTNHMLTPTHDRPSLVQGGGAVFSQDVMRSSSAQSGHRSLALYSHLRWIAALIVVLSHIRQNMLFEASYSPDFVSLYNGLITKPVLAPLNYAHAAVVVFFVLSGFLVGDKVLKLFSCLNIYRECLVFAVDRFSRIFVVLWPATLLALVVFLCLKLFIPSAPFVEIGHWSWGLSNPVNSDGHLARWIGTAVLLNEFSVPTPIINSPFWSLSYEWFYYVMALSCVILIRRMSGLIVYILLAYSLSLCVLSILYQPDILVSGLTWLSGVASRWVFNRGILRSLTSRMLGMGAVGAALVLVHLHPVPDFVLAGALALMIAHAGWRNWCFLENFGEYLAGFSYSLYAIHFPIMLVVMGVLFGAGKLAKPLPLDLFGLATAMATLAVVILSAWIFASLTEKHTRFVRDRILFSLEAL